MPVTYLHRRLCRLSTLRPAWLHVEESDGCAGVDNVTISAFAQNLEAELAILSDELANQTYKPLPLVRFFITKINGGQRPLSVPTVRDRVAQVGVISVVGSIFEKEFENCSFAYRKGRSVKQALQQIEYLHDAGYTWVLDADITSYFDNVDHGLLMARVSDLVPDEIPSFFQRPRAGTLGVLPGSAGIRPALDCNDTPRALLPATQTTSASRPAASLDIDDSLLSSVAPESNTPPEPSGQGDRPTATTASPPETDESQVPVAKNSGVDSGDGPEHPPPDQPKLPPPTLLTLRTLYIHEHGAVIRCEDEHLRNCARAWSVTLCR